MLAPNGVEEERGPGLRRVRDLRRRGGAAGAGRDRGGGRRRAGRGRSRPRSPTTGPTAGRTSTSRCWSAERLWLRPSWEEPREGAIDLVVDPGRAFGTGAHPTTRLCLELLLELEAAGEAGGPLDRSRHRLRRARDRRREARLGPGPRLRPRAAGDRGGSGERRRQRGRASLRADATCASACPPSPRPTVANLTAPVLRGCRRPADGGPGSLPADALVLLGPAARRAGRGRRRLRRRRPGRGRPSPRRRLGRPPAPSRASRGISPPPHRICLRDAIAAIDTGYKIGALPPHPRGRAGVRPDLRLRAVLLGRAAVPAGDAGDPRRGPEDPTATSSTRA